MAYTGSLNDKYYSTPASGVATEEMKKGIGRSPSAPVTNTENGQTIWKQNNQYAVGRPGSEETPVSKKTDGSGSSSANAYSNLLSSYVNGLNASLQRSRNALNAAMDSRRQGIQSNYDSAVSQLNAAYDNSANKINQNAEQSLREAYINKMLSQKNLGQQMSALGLSGGATESTLAGLYNNYGNARNNIETTKANNLSDLAFTRDTNLANALQAYNNAMAEADADRLQYEMNLEQMAMNQDSAALDRYYDLIGKLATSKNNGAYTSALQNAVSNMGNFSFTPTEATNLVQAINTTQADTTPDTTNYKTLQNLYNSLSSGSNAVSNGNANTVANANMLAQLLAQYV